jgi:SAM-dependent methyltransferase
MNKLASKSPRTEIARKSEEPEVGRPTSVLERFDAGAISLRAAREVRNREIHLPPVSVYRWWARRTEAVFGGILDAFFADRPGPGLVVDPFCGGGVIPLAAAIRGHHLYAQDLNPWAMQGLSGMLRLPSPHDIEQLTRKLEEAAEPLLRSAYATTFSDGEPATISHTFRVASATCSQCGARSRLFPHAMVSLLVRKERGRPEAILACPRGHLFYGKTGAITRCLECGLETDPDAEYTSERTVVCPQCRHTEKLQTRAMQGEWQWEVVLVERTARRRRELALATREEIRQAESPRWKPKLSLGRIPDGQETKVLLRHGFQHWHDLYPTRQRAVIEGLLAMSETVASDERALTALRMAIYGSAEMAGLLSRWDRWYLKSYEAMAGHRFNFTTLPAEPNVWGAARSGRGTVTRRLALFAKASAWLQERAAGSLTVLGPVPATTPRKAIPKGVDAYLVEGSSERMSLPSGSADLVLTDPPYHDDVQYDELSLPLRAWSRLSTEKLINEAVVNSTNGFSTGSHDYRDLLSRIFRECQRILKPTGSLILSYANRQPEAWIDLFAALEVAGFCGVNYAIVHSENETDHAKRGIRACALDLMIELSPHPAPAPRLRSKVTASGPEADYLRTVGDMCLEIGRLQSGWHVSFAQALKATPFLCGPMRSAGAKPAAT